MDPKIAASSGSEAERAELEAVLAAGIFQRSSNAARFLAYVCEKYFSGQSDQITEYDIGVNALGRRADFDTRSDSVVRVEAHRVRLRLAQYYEQNPDRPLRIVIQMGQYAPQVIRQPSASADAGDGAQDGPSPRGTTLRHLLSMPWILAPAIFLFVVVVWLVAPAQRREGAVVASPSASALANNPVVGAISAAVGEAQSTVRIRCGAAEPLLDQDGEVWQADRYYRGGQPRTVKVRAIARAADAALYASSRSGAFEYHIPLKPGIYELRLHFAEISEPTRGDGIIVNAVGENSRGIGVWVNGSEVFGGLDVASDAGGLDVADVKVLRDVSPASDGLLHLRFVEGNKGPAFVNAIEITPGTKGRMRPLRWVARSSPLKGMDGSIWLSDRYYRGGRLSSYREPVESPRPELYRAERFGNFDYQIPVPPGRYTVKLHLAENYYGRFEPPPAVGRRIFRVYSNEGVLLSNYDISKAAKGSQKATVEVFQLKANAQQKLILVFEPIRSYAFVNAIEVEDEGPLTRE